MKRKYKLHHQLPRRGLAWRLAMTFALVASGALFAATGEVVSGFIREATGIRHGNSAASGEMLAWLAWLNPRYYAMAAAVHAFGLGVHGAVLYRLLARVSLRRRLQAFLRGSIIALGALDLLAWGLLPFREAFLSAAGGIEMVAAWSYVAMSLIPLKHMWVFVRWKNAPAKALDVVVVGGGFAGLYAALGIDKKLGYHDALKVTLVDARNYFLFPPLLPSAASGAIEVRQVTYPFRRLLETSNVGFKKAEVVSVDVQSRKVTMRVDTRMGPATSVLSYDALILAPGSVTQTFGTPGVEEHGFFMRELQDAVAVRNQVVDCFERAATIVGPAHLAADGAAAASPDDLDAVRALLTFVVVGAGPTGVELATELIDLIRNVLLKRYAEIDPALPRVVLVQASPQILPGWDDALVRATAKQLKHLGVEVLLDTAVKAVAFDKVELKSGAVLAARTCAWCAGVKPHPLLAASGLPLGAGGRVAVGPDLRVPGHPEVFVLGDAAVCLDPKTGKPLPPIGQVAFQQGSYAAGAVVRILKGRPAKPFRYFDFGQLVSAGEHFAAVKLLGLRFSGRIAWVVWRALYLSKLVGVSTRLRVLVDWLLDLLIERSIAQIHTRAPRAGEGEKKKAA